MIYNGDLIRELIEERSIESLRDGYKRSLTKKVRGMKPSELEFSVIVPSNKPRISLGALKSHKKLDDDHFEDTYKSP